MANSYMSDKDMLVRMGMVPILGTIDSGVMGSVTELFDRLWLKGNKEVTVVIASGGGSATIALELYDMIKLYPGKTRALVINQAMSAAAIVLLACSERMATPNARIMVHHCTCDFNRDLLFDDDKLQKFLEEGRLFEQRFYNIIMANTKMNMEQVRSLCLSERKIYPEEAISLGFLQSIWTKPLPLPVPPDVSEDKAV